MHNSQQRYNLLFIDLRIWKNKIKSYKTYHTLFSTFLFLSSEIFWTTFGVEAGRSSTPICTKECHWEESVSPCSLRRMQTYSFLLSSCIVETTLILCRQPNPKLLQLKEILTASPFLVYSLNAAAWYWTSCSHFCCCLTFCWRKLMFFLKGNFQNVDGCVKVWVLVAERAVHETQRKKKKLILCSVITKP